MSAASYHLVHANFAQMRSSLDDPIMADFVAQIYEIEATAHHFPGFIAQPTPRDAGSVFASDVLLNMSTWESIERLYEFTYHGKHAQALEGRLKWFKHQDTPSHVLYWTPAGQFPTEREVKQRIDYLTEHAPTPHAFTFEHRFSVEEMLDYVAQ